jgi:NAD(P)-dependent dehydrogenase (short-subunit alcohol dehydrogenase family)
MGQLTNQRAIITGAASGIGAAIARRFSTEGAFVVVADINDTDGLAVAAEIGGEYVHLDVSDSVAWDKLIAAQADFDIVVLNAGVATSTNAIGETRAYPLEGVDNDAYQRIMRANLDGVVFGARAVIPGMVSRRNGHILATASLAGIVAMGLDPIYGLTKHGVVGFVKSLGAALEPHGVCISALCPGFVDTPLVSPISQEWIKSFGMGILPVEVAADLAMRALAERINGSQWTVMAGEQITQYVPAPPFTTQ